MKRKPSSHHGLLLINKSPECSSHDVVRDVRRLLNTSEVGHCGTLDPIASGLLVMLIGEATKLSQFILEGDKGYLVHVALGARSDTGDREGAIIEEKEVRVNSDRVEIALQQLKGTFQWQVPKYSAVKVDGRKLYEYAREGQEVQSPVKEMRFYDVELQDFKEKELQISLKCSKGSYVRTWVEKLGEELGCGAMVKELTRTHSYPYEVQNALKIEDVAQLLQEDKNLNELSCFIPMGEALPEWKTQKVTGKDRTLMQNGQISKDLKQKLISSFRISTDMDLGVKVVDDEGALVALLVLEKGKGYQVRRVFSYKDQTKG